MIDGFDGLTSFHVGLSMGQRDRKMALGGQTAVIEIIGSLSFRPHCKILNYDATPFPRNPRPFLKLDSVETLYYR
jgi:hypothetical protein